jgi:predicted double-glycine peptidase
MSFKSNLLHSSLLLAVAVSQAQAIAMGSNSKPDAALIKVDRLISVPLCRQATDYTCGAAALQSVLGFYGEDIREGELAEKLKSNSKDGTAYHEIADFARSRGCSVQVKTGASLGDLKKWLNSRQPVICLIQAWPDRQVKYADDWEDGHYVVAVGYDAKNIYFMDPSTLGNYTYIPIPQFLERWHDKDQHEHLSHFAMLVTKPASKYNRSVIKPLM